MASQVALNSKLKDRFLILNCEKAPWKVEHGEMTQDLTGEFENGKVIVFDRLQFHNLDFFFSQPGKWYPDWVPPLFSREIRRSTGPKHVLWDYYGNENEIRAFQDQVHLFEDSWLKIQKDLFPDYEWKLNEFSYRFNHMSLGFMHLDVPDSLYEEHQFRWFINLDTKPRILSIGPTLFELAERYWRPMRLFELGHLPPHEFVGELRRRVLDETVFKERELPRHYLTLDPGSLWLAHSSYITHGLIYGRKTACLEGHIVPSSLRNKTRHFNSMIRELQKTPQVNETKIESSVRGRRTYLDHFVDRIRSLYENRR